MIYAKKIKSTNNYLDFKKTLIDRENKKISLIAEIKKASPSAGIIVKDFDPIKIAKIYNDNGANLFVGTNRGKFFFR